MSSNLESGFDVLTVFPVELRMVGGPHDGEHFTVTAGFVCLLLPETFSWPASGCNNEAGYSLYVADPGSNTKWPTEPNAAPVLYNYAGFKPLYP